MGGAEGGGIFGDGCDALVVALDGDGAEETVERLLPPPEEPLPQPEPPEPVVEAAPPAPEPAGVTAPPFTEMVALAPMVTLPVPWATKLMAPPPPPPPSDPPDPPIVALRS